MAAEDARCAAQMLPQRLAQERQSTSRLPPTTLSLPSHFPRTNLSCGGLLPTPPLYTPVHARRALPLHPVAPRRTASGELPYTPLPVLQESRLYDLVVQMSDEAHDLVLQLQDWRRVAREQAAYTMYVYQRAPTKGGRGGLKAA